jgi:uncharacterized protein with GYD domain
MATYITLFKFTQQGIKDVKNGPQRLDSAKKAWSAAGGSIKAFYLLMGEYDGLVISEVPDDATVAKLALQTGMLGNITTQTMRAYTEEEYRKVVASLP